MRMVGKLSLMQEVSILWNGTQKLAEMRKDESHEESFYSLEWRMESHVSDGSTWRTWNLDKIHLLVIPSSLFLSWLNHTFWPFSQWKEPLYSLLISHCILERKTTSCSVVPNCHLLFKQLSSTQHCSSFFAKVRSMDNTQNTWVMIPHHVAHAIYQPFMCTPYAWRAY